MRSRWQMSGCEPDHVCDNSDGNVFSCGGSTAPTMTAREVTPAGRGTLWLIADS